MTHHAASGNPTGPGKALLVGDAVIRAHQPAELGSHVPGDTHKEALYRRHPPRNSEIEQTSVKDVVDLIRQA